MKFKIFVALCLLLMLMFVNIADSILYPEVATSMAMEQFANPSFEVDTASRAISYFRGISGWSVVVYVLIVVAMFYSNIKSLFVKFAKES